MVTHEREVTEPTSLTEGGRRLDRGAVGWSRHPLHTVALRGSWGRNKRWDYWAVQSDNLVVAVVYADVDYVGIVDIWWADLDKGTTGGRSVVDPLARRVALPDRPGTAPLRFRRGATDVAITDDEDGTRIVAAWSEDGVDASCTLRVGLPAGHESVNVVIPWSDARFQYTSKHVARPAEGTLVVGGRTRRLHDAWGVLDVGRGRWPYRTRWNWGAGSGRSSDGRVIGLQFGGRWTEGTGYTENGIVVDGVVSKIGEELAWDYDWDAPLRPWRVRSRDGSIDAELLPRHDKHGRTNALVLSTETHQVFGTWRGSVVDDAGDVHHFDGMVGFAEESRSRW